MLAHNYPNGVEKIQLVNGPNYAYSMMNNMLLIGFLFWQIFIVVWFTSKDFALLFVKKQRPPRPTTTLQK